MLRKSTTLLGLALVFGAFVACKNGDDGTGLDDTDTGSDTENPTGSHDGISPWVVEGRIYCEFIGGSAKVMTWWVEALVDDPQGVHTVKSYGHNIFGYTAQGEQELMVYPGLVCTDSGECSASFREEDYGLLCDQPDAYIFKTVVADDDGNESLPFTLPYQE